MYVPIAQRTTEEVEALHSAAEETLTVLRSTLASVPDDCDANDYGLDLADTATLRQLSSALAQFLDRDSLCIPEPSARQHL